MSMIMEIYMLSDTHIESLLINPSTVEDLMAQLNGYSMDYQPAPPKRSMLDRLLGRQPASPSAPPPPPAPAFTLVDPEGTSLDLDKAWHGVHYLLTGNPWEGEPPLDFLLGGTTVGDIDIGYGPARVHTAAAVSEFHKALTALPRAELQRRFNPAAMKKEDIYPSVWTQEGNDEWLLDALDELKDFTARCSSSGMGCVIVLS